MAVTYNFYDELTSRLRQTVTQSYTELYCENGTDIPSLGDLEPGANAVPVDVITGYGTAKLMSKDAMEIPLVKVNMTTDRYPIVMAVAGYDITFSEERALNFSGKLGTVSDTKLRLTYRSIAERLNLFAAYGESELNVRGLWNNPNVTLADLSAAASIPASITTGTALNVTQAEFNQARSFLIGVALKAATNSLGASQATDVLLPWHLFTRLSTVISPTTPSINLMQSVKEALAGDEIANTVKFRKRFEGIGTYLNANGARSDATKDRIVVYKKAPEVLSRRFEKPIAQMFPEKYAMPMNGAILYPFFSCASATAIHDPNAVFYYDVPKSDAL